MNACTPAIAIDRVQFCYGRPGPRRRDTLLALKDISLSVAAGDILCLLGPSGCGKTTLHAAGVVMNELLAMSLKTHEGEQLVHAAGEVLALHAVERREEAKVFLGGHVLVERVVLGHKPDACSRRAEGAPSPSTRTVPEVGTSTPMMRFTSVVLPQSFM